MLGGIVMGLLSAVLWQLFHRTEPVDRLGFLNGHRLVPITMAFVGTGVDWNLDTKPWLIIANGLCFAVIYYVVFRFAVIGFDLRTPGREPAEEVEDITR